MQSGKDQLLYKENFCILFIPMRVSWKHKGSSRFLKELKNILL
jgi:hypothetical protein